MSGPGKEGGSTLVDRLLRAAVLALAFVVLVVAVGGFVADWPTWPIIAAVIPMSALSLLREQRERRRRGGGRSSS